jgi:predicted transcriptional regulator
VKNRSEIELVALIIQTAISGATVTKMMYRLCLSHNQLRNYLVILRENDMLIEHGNEEQSFIATDKGRYFLHMYMELNELSTAIAYKRNIITRSYYGLLINTHIIRRAIYCIEYLVIIIRSMV